MNVIEAKRVERRAAPKPARTPAGGSFGVPDERGGADAAQ